MRQTRQGKGRMRALVLAVVGMTWTLGLPAPEAGPPGKEAKGARSGPEGKGRGGTKPGGAGEAASAGRAFAAGERDLIRAWFDEPAHHQGLPPGLAKRDRLPPGLEKHLQRNGTLPPGLEKKLHPLPDALAARLPPLPGGLRRVILGEHVILLDERTSAIVDVLFGVARLAETF